MNNLSLYTMTKDFEQAFLTLVDMDLPEDALRDTLEALEGELTLKGANVAAFILNLEAEAEKIKEAETRIAARRKVFENKAARMREYLKDNMEAAGIKKIEAIDRTFVVTLIAPRSSVVVDDAKLLPKECIRVTITEQPDKTLIGQMLKDGKEVAGVHLEYKAGLKIA